MFRQLPAGERPTRVADGTYFGFRTSHTQCGVVGVFEFLKFNLNKVATEAARVGRIARGSSPAGHRPRALELKTMGVTETEWKRMKEIIDRERRRMRPDINRGDASPPSPFQPMMLKNHTLSELVVERVCNWKND